MSRLAGDPGVWRRLRYAVGFRLPAENLDWVWHDLTDVGWRGRMLLRHLLLMTPLAGVLALALPGPWWLRLMVFLLPMIASTFVVIVSTDDLRRARLHKHGLPESRRSSRADPQ